MATPPGKPGSSGASAAGTGRSRSGGVGTDDHAVYEELHASPEFAELRRRYRSFVFPATVAFLVWYLLYVVLSNWAGGFMDTTIAGNINVALVFGLLQFLTTFVLAWLYARHAGKHFDPVAEELEGRFNAATGRRGTLHGSHDSSLDRHEDGAR